jgi:hypothetical protein
MLGLRERVIAAICEEDEVRQVLFQLSDQGDITLVMEPSRGSGPVVFAVGPELCP